LDLMTFFSKHKLPIKQLLGALGRAVLGFPTSTRAKPASSRHVDISEPRWLTRRTTVCVHEFVSIHGVLARVSDPEISNKPHIVLVICPRDNHKQFRLIRSICGLRKAYEMRIRSIRKTKCTR
jgi:hypothetical protein